MEKFEGLKEAIRNEISEVNKVAALILNIETKVCDGEIVLDEIGKNQIGALRNMHERCINDVERYKADLKIFERAE
jgi:hypothetical protein